jgi:capsular polysaccharide export protein
LQGFTASPPCPILGRLAIEARATDRCALAALFPDFAIDPNRAPPTAIAAWPGARGQGRLARRAAALGVPLLRLGRGVLRAPPGRGNGVPLLSATALAIDGPGSPADMLSADRLLATCGWETPALLQRAAATRHALTILRVGGGWWHRGELPIGRDAVVLAAEASSAPLRRAMLAAALSENPPERIVVLAADQAAARGGFATAVARGCALVTRPTDPWAVIEHARRVYSAGGETGFLALLAGREVRCFGDSFYSGWGVTADDSSAPAKPFRRTIDEIFAGACLLATRCRDPYRNIAAAFEDVVAMLADWRRIDEANRSISVLVGMSFWKRRRVADFFRSAAGPPAFRRSARAALALARRRPGSAVAVWASRAPPGLAVAAARQQTPLVQVEDGFLRSVGLGSDFMPAASLVLDRHGMHYDPRVRSGLERLLREAEFSPELTRRAGDLIARLVARGITKYNLGSSAPTLEFPAERRRILVPGQVEDDLSVRLGGGEVRGNRNLLARVRAANPDAFIIYKPHPDVEAGHRKGVVPDPLAKEFADIIVRDVSPAALLATIDELHTLTSLTGFEALLRRRRVVCYGRPFYAGWGLTTDLATVDRGRRLALEELVAGALILYPRYLDPVTRLPCSPEIVIERLDDPELWRPGLLVVTRRLQGMLARWWRGLAGPAAR